LTTCAFVESDQRCSGTCSNHIFFNPEDGERRFLRKFVFLYQTVEYLIPEDSTVIRKRCKVNTRGFETRRFPVKRGRLVVLMTIERQATYEGDTILLRPVKPLEYSGVTTSYLEERIVKGASNFFVLFLVKTDYYCEERT
jgi:hypothetical protein